MGGGFILVALQLCGCVDVPDPALVSIVVVWFFRRCVLIRCKRWQRASASLEELDL